MEPFENRPIKSGFRMVKTIWIPDTHTIRYSDESSIWVSGIRMVTVDLYLIYFYHIRPHGDTSFDHFSPQPLPFYSCIPKPHGSPQIAVPEATAPGAPPPLLGTALSEF